MAGNVIFFGYFTLNTPYEHEFNALRVYLDRLKLTHEFIGVDSRGSWQKNTQLKGEIVRDFLVRNEGKRLCYMDVDSIILSRPDRLFEIDSDIAAVMFGGQTLLSGVVLFNSNARTINCVDRWIELNRLFPDTLPDGREAWDQRTLQMAVAETNVTFEELPVAYNFIPDLSSDLYPNIMPVIMATRGRTRFEKDINDRVCHSRSAD